MSPKILYKNYWYSSGINKTMRNHLKDLSLKSLKLLNNYNLPKEKINILDIGCNDGTLLSFYQKQSNKFGIDPSQIAKRIKAKNKNYK